MTEPYFPLDTLIGAEPPTVPKTADENFAAQADRPGWLKTLGAAFRTENTVGSLIASESMPNPHRKEDGFDWNKAYAGLPPEVRLAHGSKFTDIHNQMAFDAEAGKIERERQDQLTLDSAGWRGTVAQIGAGLIDLPTLLPIGGEYLAAARGIKGVGMAAARMAVESGGAVAVQEAGLHTTQETRTLEESAIKVGMGAVLGGVLGSGIGYLSAAERAGAERALARAQRIVGGEDAAAVGDAALSGKPASTGAAAVEQIAREDLGPSGRVAAAVTNATQINPNNRAMMSPFASTREVAQQLADNAIINKLADKGESLGPSVEVMSRSSFNARLGAATKDADKIYQEYRKSVPNPMTSGEFDNAVGYAMRRGDQFTEEAQRIAGRYGMGDEEFVGKAAKAWRDKVANPFKEDAITSGLFPKDVDVTTADSWLHRFWDKQKLMQHETEAKGVFRTHFEGQLRNAGVEDWKAISDDAANAVYDKLTGKTFDESVSNLPEWIVPVTRGPLKDRTFNIPDRLVEKFLHNDAREVLHKASKTMAADTELTRRFGSADMADQLSKIVNEARDMRAKVAAAKTVQEIDDIIGKDASRLKTFVREKMGKDPLQARKDEALAYLNSEEAGNLRDIKAMRDLIRGNYGKGSDGVWSRISNAAMAYNYIRLMGGNVIANMGDVFRPAMVHGIIPYMRDGLAPLVRNMAAVKMSVAEAQEAGLVLERVMHSRLMTLAEIGDRYAENTGIERLLQNGTKIASRWNGILHFTDANQAVASVMSQNRIIKGILEGGDDRYLAYLGISKDTADRMRPILQANAEKIDGVWVAHTSKWDDPAGALRRYYRGALMKDVDSVIVQRSVGDIPLFANTPTGKMMLQFRSFNLAAHQRVLIRGLQESPTNFVSGLVAMTSLGMMASYLRAMRGGEDRFKKFQEAAQNPGYLIGEGLDLSGIFTIPFELANTMEKITKVNPIKDPIKAAFGNPNVGESQRFASRGVVSALLGPSAGLIDMASELSQRAIAKANGNSTASNDVALTKQVSQLAPYYSYPGLREGINMLIGH